MKEEFEGLRNVVAGWGALIMAYMTRQSGETWLSIAFFLLAGVAFASRVWKR